ncbi:hypothetical protein D3261_02650 [Halococcus sp. IIIV-5B]|nr:hypothetical protein D3261_02650 [Halococcus sp. IIIV-5B]
MAWQDAEPSGDTIIEKLMDVFQSNPNKAFHTRELTDKVADTSWGRVHEEERTGTIKKTEDDRADVMFDLMTTYRVRSEISRLEERGDVESRNVATEDSDIPHDWENVRYFTLA